MRKFKKIISLCIACCLVFASIGVASTQFASAKSITRKASASALGANGAYVKVTAKYTYTSTANLKAGKPSKVTLVSATTQDRWYKNILVRTSIMSKSRAKYDKAKKKYYFVIGCSVKDFSDNRPTNVSVKVYLNTPKK